MLQRLIIIKTINAENIRLVLYPLKVPLLFKLIFISFKLSLKRNLTLFIPGSSELLVKKLTATIDRLEKMNKITAK